MSEYGHPAEEKSLGELVATATRDMSTLIRKEVELAKLEIGTEAKKAGLGAGLLSGSGAVGLFALIFLSTAAALGISEGGHVPFWAGFVCIGGLYFLVASALGLLGVLQFGKFSGPKRTIRSVRTDVAWIKHPTEPPPDPDLEQLRASHHY